MPTKILVADDSATMRRVLEMTFAGEDAKVVTVENGESAVAKAAELSPDIVFADASMPGVDGYEVARRIKSNPNLARTAVIVMASQHTPYDDGKGRSAGVDDHISKPFDTQSVIDRVGQVLSRPRQSVVGGVEAPRAAASAPARPMAPVAAAPAPAPAAQRTPMQATRMGLGSPAQQPVQAAPAPMPAKPPPPAPQPIRPAAATAPMMAAAAPAPKPAPAVSAAPRPAAAVAAASADLGNKLHGLGLTKEQVEGVLALSREVIEQVVWEVVPDLAEQLIREELKRLTAE